MRKLRIAQIAPIVERVPPRKYGSTERMVHALTEELVKNGHDVTLFAAGDSESSARVSSIFPRGLREAKVRDPHGLNPWTLLHIGSAYQRQDEFDIIHDHNGIFSLPIAHMVETPTVFTIHGPLTDPIHKRLFETFSRPHFVAISEAQTRPAPTVAFSAMIRHGLPMDDYPFGRKHKGNLLFVGRIAPEKGLHIAIDVAVNLHMPLTIAAKLDEEHTAYFKEYIEPRLSSDLISWVGEVDERERNRLMSEAMCLINPIMWEEPFGLVMIEAMACGAPVIAFGRGSVPEIIESGRTGFVVRDMEEMIDAVRNISSINREECRMYALKHFNVQRMASEYEELYEHIVHQQMKLPLVTNTNQRALH